MDKTKQLLYEITECQNIKKVYNNQECVCKKIVESQEKTIEDFHLPEPWNGDLNNAKMLYISSNPSFSKNEYFPDKSWSKKKIQDYFENRFSEKYTKITNSNSLKGIKQDGSYGNVVRYWSYIRNRVAELLYDGDKNQVKHGIDYCITEVVHCKSRKEIGVEEAINECYLKYFEKIINLSKSNLIIIIGRKAFKTLLKTGLKIDKNIISRSDNKVYYQEVEVGVTVTTPRNLRC